jgi:hypothetical protein
MLFLAPPSAPAVEGADIEDSTYDYTPEAPPSQRRRVGTDSRRSPSRGTDSGQRRRSTETSNRPTSGGSSGSAAETVRMTRGARRSATDFGITDAEVSQVLAAPTRVSPEQDHPDRTRFSGSGLTVVTGADGTVLHVSRRR